MAADEARDARVTLSEEEAEPRRLALLLRLPRRLAYERAAYALRVRWLAVSPLAWLSRGGLMRGGQAVEPLASVPDAWPGNAALGGEIAHGVFPLLGRSLKDPQPPFRPLGSDERWVAR